MNGDKDFISWKKYVENKDPVHILLTVEIVGLLMLIHVLLEKHIMEGVLNS